MKLNLKRFFSNEDEKPLSLSFTVDMSDVESGGVFPFVSPVRVSAVVKPSSGAVSLVFEASYDFSVPCDRCTETISETKASKFSHLVLLSKDGYDENDDYIRIKDSELDIGELVREDVILSLPSRFLCDEACRGLCPVCGKNLNLEKCSCNDKKVDPRLEILKELIDDKL